MSPCPLATYSAALHPLAVWCLDTFGEGPPMLIGVAFGQSKVNFQPIELWEDDPIRDIAGLIAPREWDALVVVAPTRSASLRATSGTVAHALDRTGRSATELDDSCGYRRSLHAIRGPMHDACLAVLGLTGQQI